MSAMWCWIFHKTLEKCFSSSVQVCMEPVETCIQTRFKQEPQLFSFTVHTSALFCSVSAGSCGCVLLVVCWVSSMLTSFSLRKDTSSIRSSFWVSREVLLISSWVKHTHKHTNCELDAWRRRPELLIESNQTNVQISEIDPVRGLHAAPLGLKLFPH